MGPEPICRIDWATTSVPTNTLAAVCSIERRGCTSGVILLIRTARRAASAGRMKVDHPKAVNDDTLAGLHLMAARLTERIGEGQDLRARLTKALAANAWPDSVPPSQHPPPDGCRKD